jgi:hypothetical protein
MIKLLGFLLLLVAASGCTTPDPEPEKVQAIRFEPQDR